MYVNLLSRILLYELTDSNFQCIHFRSLYVIDSQRLSLLLLLSCVLYSFVFHFEKRKK